MEADDQARRYPKNENVYVSCRIYQRISVYFYWGNELFSAAGKSDDQSCIYFDLQPPTNWIMSQKW